MLLGADLTFEGVLLRVANEGTRYRMGFDVADGPEIDLHPARGVAGGGHEDDALEPGRLDGRDVVVEVVE